MKTVCRSAKYHVYQYQVDKYSDKVLRYMIDIQDTIKPLPLMSN